MTSHRENRLKYKSHLDQRGHYSCGKINATVHSNVDDPKSNSKNNGYRFTLSSMTFEHNRFALKGCHEKVWRGNSIRIMICSHFW